MRISTTLCATLALAALTVSALPQGRAGAASPARTTIFPHAKHTLGDSSTSTLPKRTLQEKMDQISKAWSELFAPMPEQPVPSPESKGTLGKSSTESFAPAPERPSVFQETKDRIGKSFSGFFAPKPEQPAASQESKGKLGTSFAESSPTPERPSRFQETKDRIGKSFSEYFPPKPEKPPRIDMDALTSEQAMAIAMSMGISGQPRRTLTGGELTESAVHLPEFPLM